MTETKPLLSNRTYDFLKWFTTIFLPAVAGLYAACAGFWGFPNVIEVVGTITAVNVFLGALLKVSTTSYQNSPETYDGAVDIVEGEDGVTRYSLNLNTDPETIDKASTFTLKVNPR